MESSPYFNTAESTDLAYRGRTLWQHCRVLSDLTSAGIITGEADDKTCKMNGSSFYLNANLNGNRIPDPLLP